MLIAAGDVSIGRRMLAQLGEVVDQAKENLSFQSAAAFLREEAPILRKTEIKVLHRVLSAMLMLVVIS